jgi:O-methyltransferase
MTAESSDDAGRLEDAQAHLAAARPATAAPPGTDAGALRSAYLDLLKLTLCDLAGPSTISVGALEDGTVMSRELRGDALRLRSAGMDWPLQGLTMIGLGRLDDLQACVESVVAAGVEGDVIEAGAWRGGASLLARATLDTLGDDRMVCVADSFEGFPDGGDDAEAVRLSAFDFLAAPLDEVRESFARLGCDRGVEFVPGYFEETLAGLAGRRWSIVRLDGDTYDATRHALAWLYPGLTVGGHLIVDDYGSFEGCRRAVDEFRREHGVTERIEKVDATCVRWRRTRDAPVPLPMAPSVRAGVAQPRRRPRQASVPTARELELARELTATRARLDAVVAERDRLAAAPWRRPRTWLLGHRARRRAR